MYFLYSVLLTLGFIILLPKFVFDAIFGGKYVAGLGERLGRLPPFDARGRRVVWLHCVSVGETNAARPVVERINRKHPEISIVVSTTTKTGQRLARELFGNRTDLIFHFPLDWRFTVRRALAHIRPSVVLLMETEIWFNFVREADRSGAHVVLINGRLSEKSFTRYAKIKKFMKRVLGHIELALMQDKADATRLMSLGIRGSKVKVTGNLKYDHDTDAADAQLTQSFRQRFGIMHDAPLIIAASTHSPEEKWLLEAFKDARSSNERLPRLMIAPRHPERFDEVRSLITKSGFTCVRRSEEPSALDKAADIILLDSIGELRAAYPLAEIVFVGGSLIPHGGQSIYEPAAAGRAVITGPYTANFKRAVEEFRERGALRLIEQASDDDVVSQLADAFNDLLSDADRRAGLGAKALAVMKDNRGAVDRTMEFLEPLLKPTAAR